VGYDEMKVSEYSVWSAPTDSRNTIANPHSL